MFKSLLVHVCTANIFTSGVSIRGILVFQTLDRSFPRLWRISWTQSLDNTCLSIYLQLCLIFLNLRHLCWQWCLLIFHSPHRLRSALGVLDLLDMKRSMIAGATISAKSKKWWRVYSNAGSQIWSILNRFTCSNIPLTPHLFPAALSLSAQIMYNFWFFFHCVCLTS